jgi:CRP-like cAMP-binding protein
MVPIETLEQLGFFEGFPPDYLTPLAAVARVVEVPAGEVLFTEGRKSANIYVVVQGKVALEIEAAARGTMPIQTVGPGRLVGWTPLLSQAPMTATARAVEPCRLIAINALQTVEACTRNPSFGVEFMRRTALALSRRLHATRLQLLDAFEDELPVMSE